MRPIASCYPRAGAVPNSWEQQTAPALLVTIVIVVQVILLRPAWTVQILAQTNIMSAVTQSPSYVASDDACPKPLSGDGSCRTNRLNCECGVQVNPDPPRKSGYLFALVHAPVILRDGSIETGPAVARLTSRDSPSARLRRRPGVLAGFIPPPARTVATAKQT